MRKTRAAAVIILLVAIISAPAAAQITGPSQSFYNDPVGFIDSLTVSDINNSQDFLVFVVLPLIGVYGLMWFVFSKVLQMAENNFAGNDNPTNDDLSEMGQRAAVLMAAAVAVVTVMRFGNFSPLLAIILFLLGLLMILQNGFSLPGLPGLPGFGGGGNGGGGGGSTDHNVNINGPDDFDVNINDNTGGGGGGQQQQQGQQGPPGPGGGGNPYQNVDLDINNDAAQQAAAMAQQMQQQNQMQMNTAMMQMMALLQGRVSPGNNGIIVDPPNGPNVVLPPQQAQQFMQMMIQVMSEGGQDFDQNVMQQMMQIMVNYEGGLDADLIQMLEQYFQKVEANPKMVQINNVEIEKVVNQQYYDISQLLVNQMTQILDNKNLNINQKAFFQLIHLLELDISSQGDTVVVHVDNGQDIQLDVSVVVQLISAIENMGSSEVGRVSQDIVNIFVEVQGPLNGDLVVKITNIIIGSGSSDTSPDVELPDVDETEFLREIEDIIEDLGSEVDIEQEVLQEKREAEERLAEALREIMDDRDILHALIYFREVDFNSPHADVHQQVEKILSNLNGIGSADQMQREMKNIQQVFGKVEKSLEELSDAYDKMSNSASRQKQDRAEIRDIQQVVGKLQQGSQNIQEYFDNYY